MADDAAADTGTTPETASADQAVGTDVIAAGDGVAATDGAGDTAASGSWKSLGAVGTSDIRDFACKDASTCIAVGAYGYTGTKGIYRTTDGGKTWTGVAAPVDQKVIGYGLQLTSVRFAAGDNAWTVGYTTDNAAHVWKSPDAGASWTEVAAKGLVTGAFAGPVEVAIAGSDVVVAQKGGISKSTDGGATFALLVGQADATHANALTVYRNLDCADALHCISAATDGAAATAFLRTADGGATWSLVTVSGAVSQDVVTDVSSQGAGNWVGVSLRHLWHSTDDGKTWTGTEVPLPGTQMLVGMNGVACNGALCLAVGGDLTGSFAPQLWRSDDGGGTWKLQTFAGAKVLTVVRIPAPDTAFIASDVGLWRGP